MRKELEKQLQLDFPFMQQNRLEEEKNIYRRWGCECSDGWYSLLHDLCSAIAERYALDKKPIDIVVVQVKEKFATLRFYYEYVDAPCPIQAFDFLDNGASLRFSPPDKTADKSRQKLRRDIAEIIRGFEMKSGSICERCGSTNAGIRKITPYRVQTLCEKCYNDHIEKIEERKNKLRPSVADMLKELKENEDKPSDIY